MLHKSGRVSHVGYKLGKGVEKCLRNAKYVCPFCTCFSLLCALLLPGLWRAVLGFVLELLCCKRNGGSKYVSEMNCRLLHWYD